MNMVLDQCPASLGYSPLATPPGRSPEGYLLARRSTCSASTQPTSLRLCHPPRAGGRCAFSPLAVGGRGDARLRLVTETRRAGRRCRGTVRGTSTGRIRVHCVRSGQVPEPLVQVERVVRRSSPLLIRGFGVRVPGGAPVLNCSNFLFRPAIMAWRGTNSLRCFDAQDDHSAQPLLTHSDRTASSTRAITRRTDRTGPAASGRHRDRGWEIVTGVGGDISRRSMRHRRGTGKSGPVDAHLTDHRRGLAAPGMSPAGPRQRRTVGLIMVHRFGLASVQPTHGDQAEPEVADLGQQPVQRGLVSEQAPDDRLLALAADLEAIEPGGPPAIQDTRHADLIPGRPAGGAHSTPSQRPGGAAERTMPGGADCSRGKDPRLPRRSRAGLRAAIPVLPAGCFSFICGR